MEGLNEVVKVSTEVSSIHLRPRWMGGDWEEEEEKIEEEKNMESSSKMNCSNKGAASESPSISSQLGALDLEKIYERR